MNEKWNENGVQRPNFNKLYEFKKLNGNKFLNF